MFRDGFSPIKDSIITSIALKFRDITDDVMTHILRVTFGALHLSDATF